MRCIPCLILVASAAFAVEVPAPAPAPAPKPQAIPVQMPAAPKQLSTIRLVAVDAAGPTKEGQAVLDALFAEGWRPVSISTVTPGATGSTIAVLATKPAPREQPAREPAKP